MALSLDDRILGEKTNYYCSSSSEDEADEHVTDEDSTSMAHPAANDRRADGRSVNTGPKGVVEDFRRFKQLEAEDRQIQEIEKLALAKKLALTCRTDAEESQAAQDDATLEELFDDIDDEFFKQYRDMRMQEVRMSLAQRKLFGSLIQLSQATFISAVDDENETVTIVLHIYEEHVRACRDVNSSLSFLAVRYPTIKFCCIQSKQAMVSKRFTEVALPALVVYKKGEVINSMVNVAKDLGDEISASDLESYLTEYGVLSEQLLVDGEIVSKSKGIRAAAVHHDDDDSD